MSINKPKKTKTKKRYSSVQRDDRNSSLDEAVTSLAEYVQNKINRGIKPQDIQINIDAYDYQNILKYILNKNFRSGNELLLIKHYLTSFPKYQCNTNVTPKQYFEDPNELINKICLCIKFESKPKNTIICQLGEIGDKFYVVFKGKIAVIIAQSYEHELSESDFIEHLKVLHSYQEYDILERTVSSNRHIYLSPQMHEIMEHLDYTKPLLQRDFSVEEYIERIRPASTPNSGEKIKVKLWTYKMVVEITAGNSFGDVALSGEEKRRNASIITLEDCDFGTIKKESYEICIKEAEEKARRNNIDNVYSQIIFQGYNKDFFEKNYFNFFKHEVFNRGHILFVQGTERKEIFFVKEGEIELSFYVSFKDLNALIRSLGGEIENYEREQKIINGNPRLKQYYTTKKWFRLKIVNRKDIIGLDEYLINNSFYCTAKVTSQKCSLFALEMNFYGNFLKEKTFLKNIENYYNVKKPMICERISQIKETFFNNFQEIIKERKPPQKIILPSASNVYIEIKKDFQIKTQNSQQESGPNIFMTANNKQNMTAQKSSRNRKKLMEITSANLSLDKQKMRERNLSQGMSGLFTKYQTNTGTTLNSPPKTLSKLKINQKKSFKYFIPRNKINPLYKNIFTNTNIKLNKHHTEKLLLKKINLQTEIINKMQESFDKSLSQEEKDKEEKSGTKDGMFSTLDFLAFDKYCEKLETKYFTKPNKPNWIPKIAIKKFKKRKFPDLGIQG